MGLAEEEGEGRGYRWCTRGSFPDIEHGHKRTLETEKANTTKKENRAAPEKMKTTSPQESGQGRENWKAACPPHTRTHTDRQTQTGARGSTSTRFVYSK